LWRIAALAACWCASAGSANAGSVGLFGAYWNPTDTDAAGGGGLKWAIPLGRSPLDLQFRGTYFASVDRTDNAFRVKVRDFPAEAGVTVNFGRQQVNPYVGGGLGYHFLDSSEGALRDEVGVYAVGGVEIGRKKGASFDVEATYRRMRGTVRSIHGTGQINISYHVDLDLSGPGVDAGVTWR